MADTISEIHPPNPADKIPVDRISHLPETIISDILSSLDTKEAVATSILSRSWRFRWTRLTSFRFKNGSESSDFAEFVRRVLNYHSGESINHFVLACGSENLCPLRVRNWIHYAVGRNVRVLDLQTSPDSKAMLRLPVSLYISGNVEILRLTGSFLVMPPPPKLVSVPFPKLSELSLNSVIYESSESFSKLISASPVLHYLEMVRTNDRDNLIDCVISSPVLKHLFIHFRDENEVSRATMSELEICLEINAPALEILHLQDTLSYDISVEPFPASLDVVLFHTRSSSSPDMIVELFESFCSAKVLALSSATMFEIDTRMEMPSFERLEKLVIFTAYTASWITLMNLVDGCVGLKELAISLFPSLKIWRDPARVPRCLASTLECLTLAGFDGGAEHVAMLKFFLMNSLRMQRVDICCAEDMNEKRFEIFDMVSQLPRVSPDCKFSLLERSEITNSFVCKELAVFPHYVRDIFLP